MADRYHTYIVGVNMADRRHDDMTDGQRTDHKVALWILRKQNDPYP